jgi:hypothetical protein
MGGLFFLAAITSLIEIWAFSMGLALSGLSSSAGITSYHE